MTEPRTAALVGAVGGAGTTRLTLELAGTLARTGATVAVLDVAFETQGLARHVEGRIDAEFARLLAAPERPLEEGLHALELDVPGRVLVCPAAAPFGTFAAAMTAEAARSVPERLAAARERADYVLVDTPPVASNPAVAAVTAVDRVAAVTPGTDRGVDGLSVLRTRLADVGAPLDHVFATRTDEEGVVGAASVAVPELDARAGAVPTSASAPDERFAPAVADAAGTLFEREFDLEFPEPRLLDGLR